MKITLTDDFPLFTESLKSLLQQHKIGEITINSTEDTPQAKDRRQPDIIITGLQSQGVNGIRRLQHDKHSGPKTRIIVLTAMADVAVIKQAIRNGASGFLSKFVSSQELIEAIREVNAGKQYIEKALRENLISNFFSEQQVTYQLSMREKDVLNRVCGGMTIKEIAHQLKLSTHTVQYYHRNVMNKLKVKRTSDLIVTAIKHGLYQPGGG